MNNFRINTAFIKSPEEIYYKGFLNNILIEETIKLERNISVEDLFKRAGNDLEKQLDSLICSICEESLYLDEESSLWLIWYLYKSSDYENNVLLNIFLDKLWD